MDPKWTRWIVASLNKHFHAAIAGAGLPLHVEGTDRRTDRLEDYAEIRHTGPRFQEVSRGYWRVEIDVDVLCVSKVNDVNIYSPEIGVGTVVAAFTREVPVFQLGDDPLSQVGCLEIAPGGEVVVTNFGAPREQVRLRQASVDATYFMHIST